MYTITYKHRIHGFVLVSQFADLKEAQWFFDCIFGATPLVSFVNYQLMCDRPK